MNLHASDCNHLHFTKHKKQRANFIHLFATESDHPLRLQKKYIPYLDKDGMLWISWNKGHAALHRESVRKLRLDVGLMNVKVISFDAIWLAPKFVYRLKDRK